MNSGRPRGLAALLTLALGAGTVAGAGVFSSPAWADATGAYSLSTTSIWTGQSITLTETELTDTTPETAPTTRTVSWGDGSTSDIAPGATSATHSYTTTGLKDVKVTILDDGVESTTAVGQVDVSAGSGTFKLNPTWNWTWPGGGHGAKLELSGVPANTKRIWVDWKDGETSLLGPKTTSTTHYYEFGTGVWNPTVTLENASGKLAPRSAGTYTLKEDTFVPTSTLKIPSSPSKAASWKTIQGTAKDTQIGIDSVGVQLWKWNNSSDYYYNFSTAKWVKYTPGSTTIPNAAVKWVGVDSAGVWKVNVAGLSKGYSLEVDYVAYDKANNHTEWKYKVQYLSS